MWVFAIIALVASAVILLIVALLLGPVVGPLYEVVVNDPAVKEMGYDSGVEVAMRIGAKWVLPLLALSIVLWFLVLRLRADHYLGGRRR